MSDFARSLRTAWFGVKSHKNALLVLSIFCVILFPAFTMITVSGQQVEYYSSGYQIVLSVYGGIVAVAAGLVFPITFFSYVYNRIECDFYNAMPVRRSQYFWGYFAASAVIFIIPWSITAIIHCFITKWGNNLWKPFLLSLGLFFVLYCAMVFAVTFSGSKLCAVLTFAIMNVLPVMVVLFPITAAGADTISYGQRLVDNIMALTPASAVYWLFDENQFSYVIPIQLGFALAELIAAFFMFKYRKSESTMALAFPKTRYYYQYGIMLLTAVYVCYLYTNGCYHLYIDFEDGRLRVQYYTNFLERDRWVQMIFFTLVFVLLAFILTNMILEKSPRAAFKKIRHYFFFLGGYAVFLLITIPLAINLLPKSVLPFTPDYAAVYVYGYEEITEEEYNKMCDNNLYFYTAEIKETVSDEKKEFIDEYGNSVQDYEYENHYYKKIIKDAFIVTDKEKLDKLTESLSDYPENEYPDFVIFPLRDSWYNLSTVRTIYDHKLPDSNYTEFKIAFGRGLNITSDIDEKELDDRITDDKYYPNINIFVKESIATRRGYAVDPSFITEYKDYNINLDPDRFLRDMPESASPAEWTYAREAELQ